MLYQDILGDVSALHNDESFIDKQGNRVDIVKTNTETEQQADEGNPNESARMIHAMRLSGANINADARQSNRRG